MSISSYLNTLPLSEVIKYAGGPPKDAIPFEGVPKQHPSDKKKLILLYDPLGETPTVIEFKLEDLLHIEDLHSAVTEAGEGIHLVKLWIRKGARGVIMEPFEVDNPIYFKQKIEDIQDRFLKSVHRQ
ncbi:hypothetical protein [Breznakiella homolactica]|uniref:Inorganic pyrophosphatase Ppa n=1 Tax=Breznakiella homolactica TaxID=2798577 RepID=A0A7T7XL90_9SPIR|nr:hypothetical protein [Breznakiella homolactica]QQO08365.1 hypothetical protein JFL75_15710 [Breznakiella homolactica]